MIASLTGIDVAPASTGDEVLQCVRTLIGLPVMTAPLHRSMGIRTTAQDAPVNMAQAMVAADVVDVVNRYEKRAEISEVRFGGDPLEGNAIPTVRVKVK
jgi:phage baseplate assembly protein W